MKNIISLLIGLIISIASQGQDALEILQKSQAECLKIQNGYYELTQHLRFIGQSDTMVYSIKCYFRKMPSDNNYGWAFHYHRMFGEMDFGEVLYTGEDLVKTDPRDSTAEIINSEKWANYIGTIKHNHIFNLYQPFYEKTCYPCMKEGGQVNDDYEIIKTGDETVNGVSCYCVEARQKPGTFKNIFFTQLRQEYQYRIDKQTFLPVQYSDLSIAVMNNDTTEQFFRYHLDHVDINNPKNDSQLSVNSIPRYFKLKTFEEVKSPPLLSKGASAPGWALVSLNNDSVKLSELKGKTVLLDFFYKSCYPCMLALPKLQALSEKYKDDGLVVIGIDPVDKKKDELRAFLAKRGVAYKTLLSDETIPKAYHVSGYPTMYLLDGNGIVVFSQTGFGQGMEDYLEMRIKKALYE